MTTVSQTIEYRDGDTQLSGMLCSASSRQGRRPGILVVHGGAGLDDHAKTRAQSFAAQGFLVFACDMYGMGVAGNRERTLTLLTEFRSEPTRLLQRAGAGLDVLANHPKVDGRFAGIGYCFGGMTVLQMARSGADFAAVVSVHGSLATALPAKPGAIKAKILVCHGALDPHVPMPHVVSFADEMKQADADWQLIMYGGAMHGFTHNAASSMPGVAYNADADRRSSIAIQAFLTELFPSRQS